MAKKTSIMDAIKVGLRVVQNFDKLKKNTIDISDTLGSLLGKGKKKEGLTKEELGIIEEK